MNNPASFTRDYRLMPNGYHPRKNPMATKVPKTTKKWGGVLDIVGGTVFFISALPMLFCLIWLGYFLTTSPQAAYKKAPIFAGANNYDAAPRLPTLQAPIAIQKRGFSDGDSSFATPSGSLSSSDERAFYSLPADHNDRRHSPDAGSVDSPDFKNFTGALYIDPLILSGVLDREGGE